MFSTRTSALLISLAANISLLVATAQADALLAADDSLRCHVVPPHELTPAENAYLSGNASQAETLHREALVKSPHDATLTAGLARSLLREQKVADAVTAVKAALSPAPSSVPLLTVF